MTVPQQTVAIVDDDEAVCESTRLLLETYGIAVETYRSGAEFLRNALNVACLIVDYHMPGMDGLELVAELRRRGTLVPAIVMITAATDPAIAHRAAELGITRLLHKPLSSGVLLGAVRDALP